jgi:hypothetical protein
MYLNADDDAAPPSQTATPANDVLRFWQTLSSASLDSARSMLTLPEHSPWLGDSKFSFPMFMRPCYSTLNALVSAADRTVVLGTPGTGKTMFGLQVAWKHLVSSSSQPLVYHGQNGPLVLVVSGRAQIVKYKDVADVMLTRSTGTFYIVDACVPLAAVCKTLLIASPKKEIWSKWQRQYGAQVAYMPVPDINELETCRSACYPAVPVSRLLILHEKWGGSFRLTLDHADTKCQAVAAAQLDSDLSAKDLSKMLEVVAAGDSSGPQGVEDVSHYVIHMLATPDCSSFSLGFASPYMCSRALMISVHREKEKVVAFIQASDSVTMLSALRGQLYERFAIAALRTGGNFRLLQLTSSDAVEPLEELQIPPREVSYFSVDDMQRVFSSRRIAVPEMFNFPTWDAAVLEPATCTHSSTASDVGTDTITDVVTFFQMTVSSPRVHGMKAGGLYHADRLVKSLSATGSRVSTRFFWVCPKLPVSREAVGLPDKVPPWARHMQQYVLVVPSASMVLLDVAVVEDALADAGAVDAEVVPSPSSFAGTPTGPMLTRKRRREMIGRVLDEDTVDASEASRSLPCS